MRPEHVAAALSFLAAGPLAAGDIALRPPLDCDLGKDCYIQQYVDHDPTPNASDFRCSNLTYDTHKGTDFALMSVQQMRDGVNVVAAAAGQVQAIRDGMQDRVLTAENRAEIEGRECGNGILLDNGEGWSTQYCHLKQGSVAVAEGEQVTTGTVLGQIGLSGFTQFPHVHITVRKDGKVIDPFAPDGSQACDGQQTETLWRDEIPYRPGGVLSAGFADNVPSYAGIVDGTVAQTSLPQTAPALVLFGYAFGGRENDVMRLTIDGPEGVFMDEKVTLDRDQARFFRAVGRKLRSASWPTGTYRGTVTLLRSGETLNTQTTVLQVQ